LSLEGENMELKKIELNTTKKKTLFFHDCKVVGKTIIFEALMVLVAFGIAYLFNFKYSIQPIVQIVSPLVK
jgi:hypothetical protein